MVVPKPVPPYVKGRDASTGSTLGIEGHRHKAQYLPLRLHPLVEMLSTDWRIQQAKNKLQSMIQDSVCEVQKEMAALSWLCQIYSYVQRWSREVLRDLWGSSAGQYEDLILQLQSWAKKVQGIHESITAPGLAVSCSHILKETGTALMMIIQDICDFLSSEISQRSHQLLQELTDALGSLQRISTDVSSFSQCVGKVNEYTWKSQAFQSRVEYVLSLNDVLRMNNRQATAEDQSLQTQLMDRWDMFLQKLKETSDILSSQKSSMGSRLQESFQSCYREAEGLISAASASVYSDPSQNAQEMLKELGQLRQRLQKLVAQLQDLSHSRDVLHGKTFDISAIVRGQKRLEAREAVWRLWSTSSEHIMAFKQKLLIKVDAENVKEKLQGWDKSLQDLGLLFSEEDPLIRRLKLFIHEFAQLLPLLLNLSGPAMKSKHWDTIFTVMGSNLPTPEKLTVSDLLTYPFLLHQEHIQKVSLTAQKEISSSQTFRRVQHFWEQREFRLSKFFLCVRTRDPSPDPSQRPPSGKFPETEEGLTTKDSGTFLLKDVGSLYNELEGSLLSLHMVNVSYLSSEMKKEVSDWMQKLQRLGHSLDLWMSFQENFVFLTRIQQELLLPLPSHEAMVEFQSIDQTYRILLSATVQDPRVLSILSGPSRSHEWEFHGEALCEALHRGINVMGKIVEGLEGVLDSFRTICPRLFFLSDQDLLRVLSASTEPEERTPCALLCFPKLTNVLFQEQSPKTTDFPLYSTRAVTVGVVGNCHETLSLNSPIKGNLEVTIWLSQLERELKEAVLYQAEKSLCYQRARGDNAITFTGCPQTWAAKVTTFPWQCLALSEEILWCETIETFLFTQHKASLKDKAQQKVTTLVHILHELHTVGGVSEDRIYLAQAVLSAWITLACLQRDRTCTLLDEGVQSCDSFAWVKMFKYRTQAEPVQTLEKHRRTQTTSGRDSPEKIEKAEGFPSQNSTDGCGVPTSRGVGSLDIQMIPNIYADVLHYQLPYHYEYVGLDTSIVECLPSDRVTLGLILALKQYQCGAVIGQDNDSRTQTLVSLGGALGYQVVVLKCWAETKLGRVSQHLRGALQGGAWLVLESVHQLNVNAQSSLGHLLWEIQSSCEALLQKDQTRDSVKSVSRPKCGYYQSQEIGIIQLEGHKVVVRENYACFMTLPYSSSMLTSNLSLLLRPVSLLTPDLRSTAEIMLMAAGFLEPSHLASKVSCFFRLAREAGAVTGNTCISFMRSVLRRAEFLLKMRNISSYTEGQEGQRRNYPEPADNKTTQSLDTHKNFKPDMNLEQEKLLLRALSSSSLLFEHPLDKHNHLMDILKGIFPMCNSPLLCPEPCASLQNAINQEMSELGLTVHSEFCCKVIQLFHAIQQSPGVLLTGPSGNGKTSCWRVLARVINRLTVSADMQRVPSEYTHKPVQTTHLFPSSFTAQELFEVLEQAKWKEGILPPILQRTAQGFRASKWLVLDGSVAPEWLEPVSCLFGHCPVLTLASGRHLRLQDSTKVLFEMTDASAITPAVLASCCMVYVGGTDTWMAVLASFMSTLYVKYQIQQSTAHQLQGLSESLTAQLLCFLGKHGTPALYPHSTQSVHTAQGVQEVSSFCAILQSLMDQHLLRNYGPQASETVTDMAELQNRGHQGAAMQKTHDSSNACSEQPDNLPIDQVNPSHHNRMVHTYFVYSIIWGFGGHLHPAQRMKFDVFLRGKLQDLFLNIDIPSDTSLFDVLPSPDGGSFRSSHEMCPRGVDLGGFVVLPQLESPRFVVRSLLSSGQSVLLVGDPGSGKTSFAQSVIPSEVTSIRIPVNPMLHPGWLRKLLIGHQEAPPNLSPPGAKTRLNHLFFLDDLHEASWAPSSSERNQTSSAKHPPQISSGNTKLGGPQTRSPETHGGNNSSVIVSGTQCSKGQPPVGHGESVPLTGDPGIEGGTNSSAKIEGGTSSYVSTSGAHSLQGQPPVGHGENLPQTSGPGIEGGTSSVSTSGAHSIQGEPPELREPQTAATDSDPKAKASLALQENVVGDPNDSLPSSTLSCDNSYPCTPCSTRSMSSTDHYPIPHFILTVEDLESLVFCHDLSPGSNEKGEFLGYGERAARFPESENSLKLVLSPSDLVHIAHLTRLLHLPQGHVVLLSQSPGTGRRSLATLAATVSKCQLVELCDSQSQEERHVLLKGASWRAGVLGSSVALLVQEEVSQNSLIEVSALLREGTLVGLYSAEQEEKALQALQQREKVHNKVYRRHVLKDRFYQRVRSNVHVMILRNLQHPLPSSLHQLSTALVFHPWDLQALTHVAEKILGPHAPHTLGLLQIEVPLSKLMSLIHVSAQQHYHRLCPTLPLITPKAFIDFIHVYLRFAADLRHRTEKEIDRLEAAVSRAKEVQEEREQCDEELRVLDEQVQAVEQEVRHWRQQLKEAQESHKLLQKQQEELERSRQRLESKLHSIQNQWQQELKEAHLKWGAAQRQLQLSELEEIRSYRHPPPLVVMVTDVLCLVLGKEQTWDGAKQLLASENFYQELQFYSVLTMADSAFSALTRSVAQPNFRPEIVRLASSAAASLCGWLCSLQHHGTVLRNLHSNKAALTQLETQAWAMAEHMAQIRLQQQKQQELEAQASHALLEVRGREKDLKEQIIESQERLKAAKECESRAARHFFSWTQALEVQNRRAFMLPVDALLVAASVTYLGALPWPRSCALWSKWQRLCQGLAVSLEPDDVGEALDGAGSAQDCSRLPLVDMLSSGAEILEWTRHGLLGDLQSQTRAVLLRASAQYAAHRLTLILDPDHLGENWLRVLLHNPAHQKRGALLHRELCVMDVCSAELGDNIQAAIHKGWWVLVTHVERNVSAVDVIRKLSASAKAAGGFGVCDPLEQEGRSCSISARQDFQLYLSTCLPLAALGEELGLLENLPQFRGIRTSLVAHGSQWQEYFRLGSTVIGPVPTSHFDHLTLFQKAILWRIVQPGKLGLVLNQMTLCVLGPQSHEEWEEQADLTCLTTPAIPIVFLLPKLGLQAPHSHPLPWILQLANNKRKEVKVVTWGQSCSSAEVARSFITCQQEGHWLVLNNLHLEDPELDHKLKYLMEASKEHSTPLNSDYHLWIITEEDALKSIPADIRYSCVSVPCGLQSDLRSILRRNCMEVAEALEEQPNRVKALQLLILHSVLIRRQEYGSSTQAQSYSWGRKELQEVLQTLKRIPQVCEDWEEALQFLTGSVIYGGFIVDEGDALSVAGLTKECLRDQPTRLPTLGPSKLLQMFVQSTKSGPWISNVQRSIRRVSPSSEAAALGLSEGVQSDTYEACGFQVLSKLLITQDVWSPGTSDVLRDCTSDIPGDDRVQPPALSLSSFSSLCPTKAPGFLGHCLSLVTELEAQCIEWQRVLEVQREVYEGQELALESRSNVSRGTVMQGEKRPPMDTIVEGSVEGTEGSEISQGVTSGEKKRWVHGKVGGGGGTFTVTSGEKEQEPLCRFLQDEWDLLRGLITQAVQNIKEAMSSCQCQGCGQVRRDVAEGFVPQGWNRYQPLGSLSPATWVRDLQLRLKLFSTYMSSPSLLNITYNLSAFQAPARLLHCLLQHGARADNKDLDQYVLHCQVLDRRSPSADKVGLRVGGLHVRHARWDTSQALLQETLSPKLCALPELSVSVVSLVKDKIPVTQNPSLHHYLCPVYTGGTEEGSAQLREAAILFLPLPSHIPPCVWSHRRVHAVSLL
ncbi:hypothetical protein XELAEV_18013976mg [Xenopus laevis]|uniref:Dynein heavy chain domain-containing protein 1 n=1 Tax=Xenopus laevis TaxID=8355 RepID=A0A974DRR0_XENLA|nr:hypothetical protein XELAEV_18013976mg [Xenopus laevis]